MVACLMRRGIIACQFPPSLPTGHVEEMWLCGPWGPPFCLQRELGVNNGTVRRMRTQIEGRWHRASVSLQAHLAHGFVNWCRLGGGVSEGQFGDLLIYSVHFWRLCLFSNKRLIDQSNCCLLMKVGARNFNQDIRVSRGIELHPHTAPEHQL